MPALRSYHQLKNCHYNTQSLSMHAYYGAGSADAIMRHKFEVFVNRSLQHIAVGHRG
jgi:hypothetical protein